MGMPPPLSTGLTPGSLGQSSAPVPLPSQGPGPAPHLPRLPVVLTLITQCWNGLLIYYFLPALWFMIGSAFPQSRCLGLKEKSVLKCVNKCHFLSLDWLTSPAHTLHALWTNYLLLFLHLFFFLCLVHSDDYGAVGREHTKSFVITSLWKFWSEKPNG